MPQICQRYRRTDHLHRDQQSHHLPQSLNPLAVIFVLLLNLCGFALKVSPVQLDMKLPKRVDVKDPLGGGFRLKRSTQRG